VAPLGLARRELKSLPPTLERGGSTWGAPRGDRLSHQGCGYDPEIQGRRGPEYRRSSLATPRGRQFQLGDASEANLTELRRGR